MAKEEPGGHMMLLHIVLFRVGFASCLQVGRVAPLREVVLYCNGVSRLSASWIFVERGFFHIVKAVASTLWLRQKFCCINFSCGPGEVLKK